jgi:hypothetical protein
VFFCLGIVQGNLLHDLSQRNGPLACQSLERGRRALTSVSIRRRGLDISTAIQGPSTLKAVNEVRGQRASRVVVFARRISLRDQSRRVSRAEGGRVVVVGRVKAGRWEGEGGRLNGG